MIFCLLFMPSMVNPFTLNWSWNGKQREYKKNPKKNDNLNINKVTLFLDPFFDMKFNLKSQISIFTFISRAFFIWNISLIIILIIIFTIYLHAKPELFFSHCYHLKRWTAILNAFNLNSCLVNNVQYQSLFN